MVTIFRGISGSQFVFSEGTPPAGASSVTIFSETVAGGAVDRGTFDSVIDLPNTRSGSVLSGLAIGDYATVTSESSKTYYCTDATVGAASWSFAYGQPNFISAPVEAWWETDRGVVDDGSGGVLRWHDYTGRYVLTSSTADRPTWHTGSVKSNFPTVLFSGSHRMCGGNILDLEDQSMSWFMVISSNPTQTSRIVDKRGTGTFGTQEGYQVSNLNGEGDFENSGVDDGTNSSTFGSHGDFWGDERPVVLQWLADRSAGQNRGIARNEGTAASAVGALINWNITSSVDFAVGFSSNINGQGFTGEIMALICFREYVTGSDRKNLEYYLRQKYFPNDAFGY